MLRHIFVLCRLASLDIQRPRVQRFLTQSLEMELKLSQSTRCALFAAFSAANFDLKPPLEMDLKPWQAALIFPGLANGSSLEAVDFVASRALEGVEKGNAAVLALAALLAEQKELLLKALHGALEEESLSEEARITLCYLRPELRGLPLPLLRLAEKHLDERLGETMRDSERLEDT